MRAALYARVSTRDQKTIPDQLSALEDYCAARGWTIQQRVSEKESGSRDTRPRRYELIRAAQCGKLDVILVWKLDRWSRSTADCLLTLADLQQHEVSFVSLTEGWDFTTPMGRAMAGMLAVFAEFEREQIAARTKEGIKRARERGVKFGRPATAQKQAALVLELLQKRDRRTGKPYTKSRIAKETGISRPSINRIIKAAAQKG